MNLMQILLNQNTFHFNLSFQQCVRTKGGFALFRGEMKEKNLVALHANVDILKSRLDVMSILNYKTISLAPHY